VWASQELVESWSGLPAFAPVGAKRARFAYQLRRCSPLQRVDRQRHPLADDALLSQAGSSYHPRPSLKAASTKVMEATHWLIKAALCASPGPVVVTAIREVLGQKPLNHRDRPGGGWLTPVPGIGGCASVRRSARNWPLGAR